MSEFEASFPDALRDLMLAALHGTRTFADLAEGYRVLDETAQRAVASGDILSVRRTIASNLLTVALITRQTVSVCQQLFENVGALGFHDAESRLIQVGAYARYCLVQGQPRLGEGELVKAIDEGRNAFPSSALAPFETLLREIRKT
jgi:hypothetical protein